MIRTWPQWPNKWPRARAWSSWPWAQRRGRIYFHESNSPDRDT